MERLTNARLATIKSIQSNTIRVEDILRADLEANKRGVLILSVTGRLVIISWVNKKLEHKEKVLEDISDALWQRGEESEVFILCHSGAFLRYNLLNDTGITCSLQLSAPSVLNSIKEKDSTIHSIKSQKLWGHTENYIVMQPQSDRLIVFATNSGDRPNLLGVIRTPPLRSAHIVDSKVLVQPITGSDLYLYSAKQCKPAEIITLVSPQRDLQYTEWGSLSCASNGSFAALTDSERRLYLAMMESRESNGKKGGIPKNKVRLRQIVWPTVIKPITLLHLSLTCSQDVLSVFCTKSFRNSEKSFYLTCKWRNEGCLSLVYEFSKPTCLIPSISNDALDLFLTQEGVCMLIDQGNSLCSRDRELNLDKHLVELGTGFQELNFAKISQVKSNIEQDLTVFLSSCNYRENWKELADQRGDQHAKIADIILSNLTRLSRDLGNKANFVALKDMSKHHFQRLKEYIENVITYVDGDEITQILLQMVEQVNFYYNSVESLTLPEGTNEDQEIMEKFQLWNDKSMEDIILYAIENKMLPAAEAYLKMKPWVYGTIYDDTIMSMCIQVGLKYPEKELLCHLDKSYGCSLKTRLYVSQTFEEIEILTHLLTQWDLLNEQELLSVHLVKSIVKWASNVMRKIPKFWNELVTPGTVLDMTIGSVTKWNSLSICLVLIDLYARTHIHNILVPVTSRAFWMYFLITNNSFMIRKWLQKYFPIDEKLLPIMWPEEKQQTTPKRIMEADRISLFGQTIYDSDSESIKSNVSCNNTELIYLEQHWDESYLSPITQDMVNDIGDTNCTCKEYLLCYLSHFGVYMLKEQNNLEKIILRRTLVPDCIKKLDKSCDFSIILADDKIHGMVLKKMASQRLYLPFFEYVKANNLNVNDFELHLPHENWFHLVNPFLNLADNQTKHNIFRLSIKNFDFIVNCNKYSDEISIPLLITMLVAPNASLSHFLGRKSIADDQTKFEVHEVNRILTSFNLTINTLITNASKEYNFLQLLLKKPDEKRTLELTMYDLLRGNISFDIGSLFTFQPNNRFGYCENSFLPDISDMKYCENKRRPELDYIYYLKTGRPTFALEYILNMIHEVPIKIQDLKRPVFGIALTSWPDISTCSSCISLLHLTGQNCEPLRYIIHAANMIIQMKSHLLKNITHEELVFSQTQLWKDEIKSVLQRICRIGSRKKAVAWLIGYLEVATIRYLNNSQIDVTMLPDTYNSSYQSALNPPNSEDEIHIIIKNLKISKYLSQMYNVDYPGKILKGLALSNCWTVFLAVSDIFQYPKECVVEASSNFSCTALKDHMQFALKKLYCKKNKHSTEDDSLEFENPESSSTSSDSFTVASTIDDDLSFKSIESHDFLDIFLECFSTKNPVKNLLEASFSIGNPVLCVLAACFESSNIEECFFVWLLSQVPLSAVGLLDMKDTSVFHLICREDFSVIFQNLLSYYVMEGYLDTLEIGLLIFYKDHYLIWVLRSLQMVKKGYMVSQITETLNSVSSQQLAQYLDSMFPHLLALGLDFYLKNNYLKEVFISGITSANEFPSLPVNWPSILYILRNLESPAPIKVKELMEAYATDTVSQLVLKMVENFTEMRHFSSAYKIAQHFGISSQNISLAEMSFTYKTQYCKNTQYLPVFMESCHKKLNDNKISVENATKFFIDLSKISSTPFSRYWCLHYALLWASSEPFASENSEVQSLDYKMCLSALEAKVIDKINIDLYQPSEANYFWEPKNNILASYDWEHVTKMSSAEKQSPIDKVYLDEAKILVNKYLEEGKLITGGRLANHFQLEHQEIEKILIVLRAAGNINFHKDVPEELRDFVVIKSSDDSIASSYVSKESSSSDMSCSSNIQYTESEEILNLKALCQGITHGRIILDNILLLVRIAEACSWSFLELVRQESMEQILYDILTLGPHYIKLSKKFIVLANIPAKTVNNMLVEEVYQALSRSIRTSKSFLNVDGFDNRWDKYLSLADDATLVGHSLLKKVKDTTDSYEDAIELLILSHKCFSKTANMEGIGFVLQMCQTMVKKLEKHSLWAQMARLLTGIRRYTELHYIIDTLKENGEFEHLLKKISDKSFKASGLDRELIHYIKSKYPNDKTSLKMVAQHFMMHSEVARIWVTEATDILNNIIQNSCILSRKKSSGTCSKSISIERNQVLSEQEYPVAVLKNVNLLSLKEALNCYAYASECYSSTEEVANSMKCVHNAELLALQISLIRSSKDKSSAIQIIQLPKTQLDEIQIKYLNVMEIDIFCKAYGIMPNWTSSIYHHYIFNGREKFFREFIHLNRLSSDIVLNLAKKMETSKLNSQQVSRLGQLLSKVTNPEIVYRVASQFRIKSSLEECLNRPSAAYLKDKVFKKGVSPL